MTSLREPGEFRTIDGLGEVADGYDGFILDLWGVLHDGVRAFPGALDALRRLKQQAKRVAILSNGPRRAAAVAERCGELGIGSELYEFLHSSGEECWLALAEGHGSTTGRRMLPIVPKKDRGLLAGLDLDPVSAPSAADFALLTGTDRPEETVADYRPILEAALAAGLPMLCANPDLEVVRGGVREICAGAIAARYEEMGGRVRYFGKPHRAVYDRCLAALAPLPPARILAVGDSLRTDIAGARGAGLDSLLVVEGIHRDELGAEGGFDAEKLRRLCRRQGCAPRFVVQEFRW
jgi:HAD superfamily hydrolase (TIGR01459 family)